MKAKTPFVNRIKFKRKTNLSQAIETCEKCLINVTQLKVPSR